MRIKKNATTGKEVNIKDKLIEQTVWEVNIKGSLYSSIELDLKNIWETLGLIIGESYEEELLDNLFKSFCLGK